MEVFLGNSLIFYGIWKLKQITTYKAEYIISLFSLMVNISDSNRLKIKKLKDEKKRSTNA